MPSRDHDFGASVTSARKGEVIGLATKRFHKRPTHLDPITITTLVLGEKLLEIIEGISFAVPEGATCHRIL